MSFYGVCDLCGKGDVWIVHTVNPFSACADCWKDQPQGNLVEDYTFPEKIILSEEAFDELSELIANPRKPTQALIDLMRARKAVGG